MTVTQEEHELLEKRESLTKKLKELSSSTASFTKFLSMKGEIAKTFTERAKVLLKLGWGVPAIYDYCRKRQYKVHRPNKQSPKGRGRRKLPERPTNQLGPVPNG